MLSVEKMYDINFCPEQRLLFSGKDKKKYFFMFYDYIAEEKTLLIYKSNCPITYLIFVTSVKPRHPFNL